MVGGVVVGGWFVGACTTTVLVHPTSHTASSAPRSVFTCPSPPRSGLSATGRGHHRIRLAGCAKECHGQRFAGGIHAGGSITRSGSGCGNLVRLIRYPLDGPATVLWRLPSGGDVASTRVHVSPEGDTTLYFDNFGCGQLAASDVWQIVE